jgi:hypothetical protein
MAAATEGVLSDFKAIPALAGRLLRGRPWRCFFGVVDVDDAGGLLWACRVDRQSALGEPISSMGQFGHGKAHIS